MKASNTNDLLDIQHRLRTIERSAVTANKGLDVLACRLHAHLQANVPNGDTEAAEYDWDTYTLREAIADVEASMQLLDDVSGRLRWAYSRARAVSLTWEDA